MPRTSHHRCDSGAWDAAPSGLVPRFSPKSFERDASPLLRKNSINFLVQICEIKQGKARSGNGVGAAVAAEGSAVGHGEARGQLQLNLLISRILGEGGEDSEGKMEFGVGSSAQRKQRGKSGLVVIPRDVSPSARCLLNNECFLFSLV